ncbi:MAG: flippase [Anaerolineae bacterium]|nr:flippase [Anaerolineae bacterium]
MSLLTGRKIVRNFFSLAASSTLDRALRFVAYSYLARVLGVEAFGVNSFAYTAFMFFSGVGDFGIRTLGSREIATHKEDVKTYASNLWTMSLVLSVIAFVAMQIFAGVTEPRIEVKLLFLIYGISVLANPRIIDWVLLGMEEMQFVGGIIALNGILNCGLLLFFISKPEHLLRVAVIESGVNVTTAVVLFFIARRTIGGIRLSFDTKLWRYLWKSQVPLGFSLLLLRLFATAPTLILGTLRPDSEAGVFRAGNMIPNFLLQIALHFADTLLPVLSRSFVTDQKKLRRIISIAFRAMATLGAPIAIGGTFLARPIITLVFGEAYTASVGVFQLMVLSSIFVYPGMVLRHALPACHKQRPYLKVMILRTSILVVLCAVLIPLIGVLGAGVAFLLAELGGFLLSTFFFQRHILHIPMLHYTWKALLSGAIMAVVFGLLGTPTTVRSLLLTGGLGVLGYGLFFTFVLKGISTDEMRFLRNMLLAKGHVPG